MVHVSSVKTTRGLHKIRDRVLYPFAVQEKSSTQRDSVWRVRITGKYQLIKDAVKMRNVEHGK